MILDPGLTHPLLTSSRFVSFTLLRSLQLFAQSPRLFRVLCVTGGEGLCDGMNALQLRPMRSMIHAHALERPKRRLLLGSGSC